MNAFAIGSSRVDLDGARSLCRNRSVAIQRHVVQTVQRSQEVFEAEPGIQWCGFGVASSSSAVADLLGAELYIPTSRAITNAM